MVALHVDEHAVGVDGSEVVSDEHEHGVGDWTVFLLTLDDRERRDLRGPLDHQPIPYLALVDGAGMVEAGPPWLTVDALGDQLARAPR